MQESPQDKASDDEVNDVVTNIDFKKLLQPSSSEYYYSNANRSNRQLLEKVKKIKPSSRNSGADALPDARVSILSERLKASSYRGPPPSRSDGSFVKSAMKRRYRSAEQFCLSTDSALASADGESEPDKGVARRCVFTCVDIREHERVAGDNPCVSKGVPLSIGWGYYQHESINLDDYEYNRGPARDKIEMMVPAEVRKEILRDEFGVSIEDIDAAMRDVAITKRHRKHTAGTEPLEGLLEAKESTKRKMKRFFKGTTTAQEEEKLWVQAQKRVVSN